MPQPAYGAMLSIGSQNPFAERLLMHPAPYRGRYISAPHQVSVNNCALSYPPWYKGRIYQSHGQFRRCDIDGWMADYYFQLDKDPDEFYLVAIFKDKETNQANADAPDQHERYLKFRSFLVDDPEWNDGFIVSATGPNAKV